jgi:acyl transferase domain-containing protein
MNRQPGLPPETSALSSEGISFSYDAKASGFGRGEGAACLLVKRLEDAIRCGDPVHAVIRNSACSHSGRSDGITMPRRSAQEQLLWRVHQDVGLDPSETAVVEVQSHLSRMSDLANSLIRGMALALKLGRSSRRHSDVHS